MCFYKMSISDIFKELNSSYMGLNDIDAEKSLKKYGENVISKKKKESFLLIYLRQFYDLLVIILLICALISFLTSNIGSAVVIIIVLNMNALIGTIQFVKASKTLETLKKLGEREIEVIRNNHLIKIKETKIVVGDIIKVKMGDVVCADGRVVEDNNLEVDESALSGESTSKIKDSKQMFEEKTTFDQSNMLFSGSKILNGNGTYIVTAVGNESLIGSIAKMINETKEEKTPLEKNLHNLSYYLAIWILIICAVVYFLSIFQGKNLSESLMFSIALAVAAIPEAMGAIVTICLAIGVLKLTNYNALVRNLKKVETLGAVSVVCSDKTGTITQNNMKVIEEHAIDKKGLYEAILICNETAEISNPTDKALYEYASKKNVIKKTPLKTKPFNSNDKYMEAYLDGETYVKGAYEVLKKRIIRYNGHLIRSVDIEKLDRIHYQMASKGLRVITFLKGRDELSFIGFVGLIDPPKEGVKDAVASVKKAKIKVMMITGDNKDTARAIAKDVGIDYENVLTGEEMDKLSDKELQKKVKKTFIYARTTPKDKLRLVKALKDNNEIVAMTGDGINDAPALKNADIGIAMSSGMEITKEAADIILLDNDFSTIKQAILNGKNIYFNIRNAIRFLISGNMAGIIIALYTAVFQLPFPFTPVQLLFVNLLTDSLPAIAIGMEVANKKIMDYPPRPINENIINYKIIKKIIFEGVLIAMVTIAAYYLGLAKNSLGLCFLVLCLARLFAGFNPRGEGSIFRYGIKNKWLVGSVLLGVSLINIIMFIPYFATIFHTGGFQFKEIIFIYSLAFLPTFIIQVLKFINEERKKCPI